MGWMTEGEYIAEMLNVSQVNADAEVGEAGEAVAVHTAQPKRTERHLAESMWLPWNKANWPDIR